MAKLRERFGELFVLVGGVALLIGIVLVINAVSVGDEPQVKPEDQEGSIAGLGRERVLDYYAEGITVLALEYAIRLDEREVRALLDDLEMGLEIGDVSALAIIVQDWRDSPAEKARLVKDGLLESGDVPSEVIQSIADVLAKRYSSNSP